MTTTTNDLDRLNGESCPETCPTCGSAFRKLYTFGVGPYCGAGCAEVATYRCGHAVSARFDPCGILRTLVKVRSNYSEAAGDARFHVMDMRSRGMA